MARPTPIRSAEPSSKSARAWARVVTPPVRRTGIRTACRCPERAGFSQPAASGVSGDAPVHIPELKRETFAKAHEQWYNAANALIVPDGTLYLDAALVLLDEALPAGQRQPTPPPPLQVRAHGGTTVVD